MNVPGTTLALQRRGAAAQANTQTGMTLAEIRKTVTPQEIAACLKECLTATITTKEGTVPNYSVRIQAVQIALNYLEGKPVERQEIVEVKVGEDDAAVMARIMKSKAARAHLRKMIDDADAECAIGV
jgi:hypothetical protein